MPSPIKRLSDLSGLKVTVMGLGLNGGGLATARFLATRGALVTVTDMKDEASLAASVRELEGLPIRYVLGRHELADFSEADLVIKNPAVRPDSPYLAVAKAVETDISLFLRFSPSPVLAVTGSKGKSTVSTALHRVLAEAGFDPLLGGNITVSPLSFMEECRPGRPVVLELSSWQLGDMKGLGVLKPKVAVLTSIMPDHMNRYRSMDEYVADKRLIYAEQDGDCHTVVSRDDPWGRVFAAETRGRVSWYASRREEGLPGAWLEGAPGRERGWIAGPKGLEEILPEELKVPGPHQRRNLLAVGLAARLYGAEPAAIRRGLADFGGVEHRLELFAEAGGVRFYNDSAATIPQAVSVALEAMDRPVVLVTGGTDKNIDFEPCRAAYKKAKALVLLAGTGTEKLRPLLDADGTPYIGPFAEFEPALRRAFDEAKPGEALMLSPGCTSFGMFTHEFDRGNKFKELVRKLVAERGWAGPGA